MSNGYVLSVLLISSLMAFESKGSPNACKYLYWDDSATALGMMKVRPNNMLELYFKEPPAETRIPRSAIDILRTEAKRNIEYVHQIQMLMHLLDRAFDSSNVSPEMKNQIHQWLESEEPGRTVNLADPKFRGNLILRLRALFDIKLKDVFETAKEAKMEDGLQPNSVL